MIVNEIPVNLTLPKSRVPRSEGVHISNIIRSIATEVGILKPEWAEELSLVDGRQVTDPVAVLRMNIGLAWEEYYIPTFLGELGVVDHPGQIQVDGVYMTPDGESVDVIITRSQGKYRNHTLIVHECKVTYKSTKTVGDLSNEWMWMSQVKAYCKGKNTRWARMHILFLCGDYSYPIRPQLRCWAIEFTQKEIDDNWALLTEHRDQKEGK